jgi:hypothetical protein
LLVWFYLDHAVEEAVNERFTVAEVTVFDEVTALLAHTTLGRGELEGPHAVGDLVEVLTSGVDLVDHIFNTDDGVGGVLSLDLLVVRDLDALVVGLEVTALVDEATDGLEGGVTIGDVGFDEAEHVLHGLVDLDEDGVEDLAEAEELEDLALLGGDLGDTTDTDDDGDLRLFFEEEVAGRLGLALLGGELGGGGAVGAGVVAGAFEGLLLEGLLFGVVGGDGSLEGGGLFALEGGALNSGFGSRDGLSGHFSTKKGRKRFFVFLEGFFCEKH